MKKLLVALAISMMGLGCKVFAYGGYFDAPTAGTASFQTITQHQFEKNETLDFVNDSEEYKNKREKKEQYLDYKEGKVDIPKTYSTSETRYYSRPGSNNLEFSKDDNGRIIIRNSN